MSSNVSPPVVHQSWCALGRGSNSACTCGAGLSFGSRSERLSRPDLFMGVAELYGQRSSCPRANVGAVAVRDGRIIAAGYCGAPSGLRHCTDIGCDIGPDGGCTRSVHAEANMIAWAARTGTELEATEVYCTHQPCYNCAKLLANAGITALHAAEYYRDKAGWNLLKALGVRVTLLGPKR